MPSPGPGAPEHPHLRALARQAERTQRRVEELDGLVRELAESLAELSDPSSAGSPGPGGGSGVRAWLLSDDPDQAQTDLADLIDWLDRVYLTYPDTQLPTCWLWHPTVVEELWWLRRAHADAYHPETGSWLRAGDWHDRQRPGVVRRVRAAVNTCELSEHQPNRPAAHETPGAPMTTAAPTIAGWVAAGRPAPAPEPTEDQIEAAERLFHEEMNRRSRR